jgi:hypothetical protein
MIENEKNNYSADKYIHDNNTYIFIVILNK